MYVANAKGASLSVVDTATITNIADIEVGRRPVQVGAHDRQFDFASRTDENAVAKVAITTRTLVDKVMPGMGH